MNKTILSLQLNRISSNSPLVNFPRTMQPSTLLVRNSMFSHSFKSFSRSFEDSKITLSKTVMKYFLSAVIEINPIDDKRCDHIDDTEFHSENSLILYHICTYVRNCTWNDTVLSSISTEGHIQCQNCGFYNCQSPSNGGAIFQNATNDLVLVDTVFYNCKSSMSGGAIWSRTKNIVFYMTQFEGCTSTQGTCLDLEGRSFIAEYFYISKNCGSFNFTENDVAFYPGYYVIINHSTMAINLYFNVENITIEDADITPSSGYGIIGTLTTVAEFTNVGFYTTNCFILPDDCRLINNGIYAPSAYSNFNPKVSGVQLNYNRPARPERTPSPTSSSSGGGGTSDSTSGSTGLKAGYIVLIVFACLIFIAALFGAIWFCCTKVNCSCDGCCKSEDEVVTYNFG